MLPFSDQHRYVIPPSQMENLVYNLTGGKKGSGGQAKNWADKGKKSEIITPAMLRETVEAYGGDEEWTRIEEYDWGTVKFGHLIGKLVQSGRLRHDLNVYNKIEYYFNGSVLPEFDPTIEPDTLYSGLLTIENFEDNITPEYTEALNIYLMYVYGYFIEGIHYTKIIQNELLIRYSNQSDFFNYTEQSQVSSSEYVYKWFENDSIQLINTEDLQEGDFICQQDSYDLAVDQSYLSIEPPYTYQKYLEAAFGMALDQWHFVYPNLKYSMYIPEIDSSGNFFVSNPNMLKTIASN